MYFRPCIIVQTFSNYQLNAQFLYSSTICMLHEFYVHGTVHLSNTSYINTNEMQLFFFPFGFYNSNMFRTQFGSIIRSITNCSSSHWCVSWVRGRINPVWGSLAVCIIFHGSMGLMAWLLLQFVILLMMDANCVRNM